MIFVGSSLALSIFGVKHKPKAIAGTGEHVGAVACPNLVVSGNILNYTHSHFVINVFLIQTEK